MADSATAPDTDYPEIVFGLVAPLGIHLERVTRILEGELRRVGYSAEVLRLSELDLGQNVSEAFPHADFFVDATSKDSLGEGLRRTIEIYFGNHFHTPTRDEFGMYQAAAAARRSADLSRQVGAALTNTAGDLMALGCNDTPKFGGGLYWTGDEPDGRDFALFGHDPAEQTRRDIVTEVLVRLRSEKYLSPKGSKPKASALADKLISGPLKGATITRLLEFGRVLHAEMAAITDAAKRGVATAGSTLFCTTFPCHLCTRIIVAAGVARVVFIEPYPKSKSQDLYPDSISVDDLTGDNKKVSFEPFVGVAPRRNGLAIEWDSKKARPRLRSRIQSGYLQAESVCTADIDDILGAGGLRLRG